MQCFRGGIVKKGYKYQNDIKTDLKVIDDMLNNSERISSETLSNIENKFNIISRRIKLTKKDNICKSIIRNTKIFGKLLHGACPYVVVAGLVFGVQTLTFDTPFIRQNQLNIKLHEETFINGVQTSENAEYHVQSDTSYSEASHTTPWVKGDDGNYHRTVEKYNGLVLLPNVVKEAIDNPETKLEDVFGKVRYQKNEVKREADITEEEKTKGEEYKIIRRYKDEADVMMIAQDSSINILFGLLYLTLTGVFILPVIVYNCDNSNFILSNEISLIRENFDLIGLNINELNKLFYEGKIRFEKIKRNAVTLTDPIDGSKIYVK